MGDPKPETRDPKPDDALRASLDHAAAAVNWPAFDRRLSLRLSAERPRRSPWLAVAIGLRLAAAALLVALGLVFLTSFRDGPPAPAPPAPLAARDRTLNDLLAQLPAAGVDERWIDARVR